jgi:hypothetical protein
MSPTVPLACSLLLLAACGEPAGLPPDPEDTGTMDGRATEEHNFGWLGKLDCANPGARPGADIVFSWEGLERDIYGEPLDPIGRAHVYLFHRHSTDEMLQRLLTDSLSQSDVGAYGFCEPTGAECRLDEFDLPGHPLDLPERFTVGSGTWMVTLTSALDDKPMSLLVLKPEEGSEQERVSFDGEACALEHHAQLGEPLAVPAEGPAWIDWSALDRDGSGRPIEPDDFDTLRLLRLEASPREAMEGIFLLPELAEERWETRATGMMELNLHELVHDQEAEEASLDPRALWLLGFWDMGASFDAPKALLHIQPR